MQQAITPVILLIIFISLSSPSHADVLAVILACHRSSQLKKTLRSLSSLHVPSCIHVHVSIDAHPKSHRALYAAQSFPLVSQIWQHNPPSTYPAYTPRDRIARHYNFVLSKVFEDPVHQNITHVILLEDDLLFAPDFFAYILNASTHLNSVDDNAVVCASAWNDNGRREANSHSASLTTFFPGLGWTLARVFWESFLRYNWPASPTASTYSMVGIGWDFWLRLAFEEHGWSCLIPDVSRVFHFGAMGVNVKVQETETLFSTSLLATIPVDAVNWKTVLNKAANISDVSEKIQQRLVHGTLVTCVEDALQAPHATAIMPYLREHFREDIAAPFKLWPTPRGHFHHTLLITIPPAGNNLLLYDARRAARRFKLPPAQQNTYTPFTKFVLAASNTSCDEACIDLGMQCSVTALEIVNDCKYLKHGMPDKCKIGCAYETGADLPAQVQHNAPLATAGMCLIAESGTGAGGQLDCQGRFPWTTRACTCVANMGDLTAGASNNQHTAGQHDEL